MDRDPFAIIEDALRFYADTQTTDGLVPAGPNPILLADSGDRARQALAVLAEAELDYCKRNSEMLYAIKELIANGQKPLPWPGWQRSDGDPLKKEIR